LKITLFTFYYPPDLSAGSFRAVALINALSRKINHKDELHVITTHPNRYASFEVSANDKEKFNNITIHRIKIPSHHSGMISQSYAFFRYAISAFSICKKIKPNFLIGTTGRLMTGILTGITANRLGCKYFIDLRDIFSEAISDIFSQKNILIGSILKVVFFNLEKKLVIHSAGVNVVSEAFPEYFQLKGINTSHWTFFPNGVDKEFINLKVKKNINHNEVKTILYAGNIGSGQGLDIVLPEIAKEIGNDYVFIVIGDGGKKNNLVERIRKNNIRNIKVVAPVSRSVLIDYYKKSDFLFLHLNCFPAFRRVLPSKIFEYGAIGKPIIAGLSGYSAKFMKDHLPYASIFEPGDFQAASDSILEISELIDDNIINDFIQNFSREILMNQMAEHILKTIHSVKPN
tara:strand:- start:92 stop:1294 length:1203 start_codon:yes stop_codon:yes gene_type:complete